ncbi:MAG: signal peptidase I [Oscillospiraceae bacterium]|nr:signal peptidase I [Oscillospiraceae bacterium]
MSNETEKNEITEETAETAAETAENTIPAENTEETAENAEPAAETAEEEKKKKYTAKDFLNDVFDIGETLCIFMLIFYLLKAFVFEQAIVDGDSMVPTLHDKEKLLYSRMYTPDNDDIVIADNDRLGLIVKRIVAVGGQVVDIRDGKVYVDGQQLDEQVYSEGEVLTASHFVNSVTEPRLYNTELQYPCTVPEGKVFLMGDNRGISEDSRGVIVGFVDEEDILGKVFLRYSPFKDFKVFF